MTEFEHIRFSEKDHKYTNINTGETYISGTQLLSLFKPEFNSKELAERVAKKKGITADAILNEWADIAKIATTKGTAIHESIESLIMREPEKMHNEYSSIAKSALLTIEQTFGNLSNLKSEVIVYNDDYKIASQSDLVQRYTPKFSKYEIINIIDYKTNKEIRFTSKYQEYLKEPISHLAECEYNVYSLQLSLYAYLLEGMYPKSKIGQLAIMWLNNSNKWIIYQVPYMKQEVIAILNTYKHKYLG